MEETPKASKNLANQFSNFRNSESQTNETLSVYNQLEGLLSETGFVQADVSDALGILYNDQLLCRSESFTKVIDLLSTDNSTITISNEDRHANMCLMASGVGFRTAMQEGFSGRDVGSVVKVVISFSGDNLIEKLPLSASDSLWSTKPDTAKVSLGGSGEIRREDLAMVSFRFPMKYFPVDKLSDDEKEKLEEEGIKFIVRHYLSPNKKIAH